MASRLYSLPIGELVGKTFGVLLRNLVPFVVLSALVMAPWIAMRIALEDDLAGENGPVFGLILMLVQSLLASLLTGAVTFGVVQHLRKQPAHIADAISKGLSSFGRVLGTSLLCGIRILLWSLLLYVPGIIETIRLYVAIPAAVMEGKSGGAAIARSKLLTTGSGWPIFGAWFLVALIAFGLGMLGFYVVHNLDPDIEAKPMWLEIGIALVLSPFGATMAAVAYFMLRQGKENVDPTQIAAVFD